MSNITIQIIKQYERQLLSLFNNQILNTSSSLTSSTSILSPNITSTSSLSSITTSTNTPQPSPPPSSSTNEETTEELTNLLTEISSWIVNKQHLKQTNILKILTNIKRIYLKNERIQQNIENIITNWKEIYQKNLNYERKEYSKMKLEDYFLLDCELPSLSERVFIPSSNVTNINDRIHYLKVSPSSSSSNGSSSKSSRSNSNQQNNSLPIVYWMSRDQRLHDNWALLFAQNKALEYKVPFCIVFSLTSSFPGANIRSYGFMLRGLKLLQLECENYNIPFYILCGSPDEVVSKFCNDNNVGTLITDFSPLNISKLWKQNISSRTTTKLQFIEVCNFN